MTPKSDTWRHEISPASAPEDDRIPESGEAPRSSDTLIQLDPGAPDPDAHQTAAADWETDGEAGASAADESTGRTEPLNPRRP
jgi:hypothetical protein